MFAEEQNRATGGGTHDPKIIDVEESGSGGPQAGLHLTPSDPSDPAGSLQRFLGELQGISNIARGMAQLTGQMDARNSADAEKLFHFMASRCEEEFARHFEQWGWPESSTPEMVQEWTHMQLVEGVGTLGATLRSVEGLFRNVYLQMRQSQIEQQTQRLYVAKLEKGRSVRGWPQ